MRKNRFSRRNRQIKKPITGKSDFYQSTQWRKVRKRFLATTNGLCVFCYKNNLLTRATVVDHIDPLKGNDYTHNWDKAFGFENLRPLCWQCHEERHGRSGSPTRAGFAFNELGELVRK